MTLSQKLAIVERFKNGESISSIACSNPAYWIDAEEIIRDFVKGNLRQRDPLKEPAKRKRRK